MAFGKGKARGIGTFLIGAIAAAFLGRIIIGFLGAFGAIGLLIVGYLLYQRGKGGQMGAALGFTGVALGVLGAGGLLGI